jgi:hypothetical protein
MMEWGTQTAGWMHTTPVHLCTCTPSFVHAHGALIHPCASAPSFPHACAVRSCPPRSFVHVSSSSLRTCTHLFHHGSHLTPFAHAQPHALVHAYPPCAPLSASIHACTILTRPHSQPWALAVITVPVHNIQELASK